MSEVKEQIQQFSSKAEDLLDTIGQPLKPYIPAISRFLIVATFLEDSLRIITQWGDQVFYMQNHRNFFWGLSHLFLAINVVVSVCFLLLKNYDTGSARPAPIYQTRPRI